MLNDRLDSLLITEVVGVDTFHLVRGFSRNAEVKIKHIVREFPAVDQDDARIDSRNIVAGVRRKRAGCNEYTFSRPLSVKRANKFLYLRAPDSSLPPLGLDIDGV